jgi:hypothetical protein
VGERPLESDDSRASNMGLAAVDPIDEDTPEDDSELSCPVPAERRDIGIVLGAAPSAVEEEGGGVSVLFGAMLGRRFLGVVGGLSSPGLGPFDFCCLSGLWAFI